MTVCIAGLFQWNYGTREAPSWGYAAIAASDRKITAGDVQYEPQKLKIAFITKQAMILVAGDYSWHSEAIVDVQNQIKGDISISPQNIALIYGQAIQKIKRRESEDLYLSPLGLNTDTFLAQQRDLSEGFVDKITNQLQRHEGQDVSALVVASDGTRAHLLEIDNKGTVTTLNDLSFGAVGIGAWHAKSRLMQASYTDTFMYAPAITHVFAAKRAAETAPGVGRHTDMFVLLKDTIQSVESELVAKLEELHEDYIRGRSTLEQTSVNEIQKFFDGEAENKKSSGTQS